MQYRDVKYALDFNDKFIKFENTSLTQTGKRIEPYPNGIKYMAIPENFKNSYHNFARTIIDRTYTWAKFEKDNELRLVLR